MVLAWICLVLGAMMMIGSIYEPIKYPHSYDMYSFRTLSGIAVGFVIFYFGWWLRLKKKKQ